MFLRIMKIQVVISVVALCFVFADRTHAITRAQMENLSNGLRSVCVKKVQADIDLVAGLREGKFPEGNTPLKCYTKCIMVLAKTLKGNKADLITLEKQIKAMTSDDVADRIFAAAKKCYSEIDEKDLCEYTWKYTICTYKADPEIFFFP